MHRKRLQVSPTKLMDYPSVLFSYVVTQTPFYLNTSLSIYQQTKQRRKNKGCCMGVNTQRWRKWSEGRAHRKLGWWRAKGWREERRVKACVVLEKRCYVSNSLMTAERKATSMLWIAATLMSPQVLSKESSGWSERPLHVVSVTGQRWANFWGSGRHTRIKKLKLLCS